MSTHLLKSALSAGAIWLLNNYRSLSVRLFKIEATKAYLKGVRLARLSVLGLLALGAVLALIGLGVLLLHIGLFVLLPWTVEAKAILGLSLGAVYVAAGGLALRAALSEKTWMAQSGAAAMLADATGGHREAERP